MTFINKTKQIYLFFLVAALFAACSHSKKDIDVSNIPVTVKIERFDHDFDEMTRKPMAQQAAFLQQKYGVFYKDFMATLLGTAGSDINNPAYLDSLKEVFATNDYHALKHDVDSVYPNLDKIDAQLTDAFKHIKYYFPDKKLPAVYAYFSGFQVQIAEGGDYVGIGLDMFLGANSRFYPALVHRIPRYLSKHFNPEDICPRVVEAIAKEDMFPESDSDKTMLQKMIYAGKVLYFTDCMLPKTPDTLKIDYSKAQLNWCNKYKSEIWAYFLDQNLLYETDELKQEKFLGDAPFTAGIGDQNEASPKLGVWTGWQIVRQYMDKNPDVTLEQLMKDNDAQKILNGAKYHPKDGGEE